MLINVRTDHWSSSGIALGAFIIGLRERPADWLRRRVDTIHGWDSHTVERRITLDISMRTVEELAKDSGLGRVRDGGMLVLPLLLVDKAPIFGFSIRDETDSPIPLATRAENAFVAETALAATLPAGRPSELVWRYLQDRVREFPTWGREREPVDWPTPKWDARAEADWRALMGDERTVQWLTSFTRKWIVIIALPTRPSPRIVKLRYSEPVPPLDVNQWSPVRSARVWVPAAGIGLAASHHVTVDVPPGLVLTAADLQAAPEYGYRQRLQRTRAHIYGEATTRRLGEAQATLVLSVPWRILAWATAIAGFAWANLLLFALNDQATIRTLALPALATMLLVLVPGLILIYLPKPGEHPLLRRVMWPIRVALLGLVLLLFISLYLKAFKVGDDAAFQTFTGAITWFTLAAALGGGMFLALFVTFAATGWVYKKARELYGETELRAEKVVPPGHGAGRSWWLWLLAGSAWIVIALVVLQFDQPSVRTVEVIGLMFMLAAAQEFATAALAERRKWLWVLFGLLFVAAGGIVIVLPNNTFAAMADVLAFLFLLVGVFWIIQAFAEREQYELWWLGLIAGIAMVVLAFWTAGQFFITKAYVLLVFAGIWALMYGVTDIVRAFEVRRLGLPDDGTSSEPAPAEAQAENEERNLRDS